MIFNVFVFASLALPLTVQLLILALYRGVPQYINKVKAPIGCTIIGWSCYGLTAALFILRLINESSRIINALTIAAAVLALLFLAITHSLCIESYGRILSGKYSAAT